MKKLITGAIVAAALAVPATPALAIHDTTGMPGALCSNPNSQAVGHPATGKANTAHVNQNVLDPLFTAKRLAGFNPPCRFND
jgi:hypothetical protein